MKVQGYLNLEWIIFLPEDIDFDLHRGHNTDLQHLILYPTVHESNLIPPTHFTVNNAEEYDDASICVIVTIEDQSSEGK